MANARTKAEQADQMAMKAEQDSDQARLKAKEFAPEFHQPGKVVSGVWFEIKQRSISGYC